MRSSHLSITKATSSWVCLLIDVKIIGCYIGDRSKELVVLLWQSISAVYKTCHVQQRDKLYTDA